MELPNTSHVRDVLRHLARDRAPMGTPLAELRMVREKVVSSGLRPTRAACTQELGCLLTDIVETELEKLRSHVRPQDGADRHDWLQQLVLDFRSGHLDLESWSAIYHVYLRPDLGLTLGNLEALLGDRHRRTIQRRLKHGTEALATRLRDLERDAAGQDASAQRVGWRPLPWRAPCLGRADLVRAVTQDLARGDGRRPFALSGPPGIGKTSVALQVASAFDRPPCAHDVLWVDARRDRALVCSRTALARTLRRDEADPMLLLVDALDDPHIVPGLLRAVAAAPRAVQVLLVGRVQWDGSSGVSARSVPPLEEAAALQVLRQAAAARGMGTIVAAPDAKLRPIATAAAGHPAALVAAVGELRYAGPNEVAAAFHAQTGPGAAFTDALWSEPWSDVGARGRRAVALVAANAAGHRGVDVTRLERAWPDDPAALREGLSEAVAHGLLVATVGAGRPTYRCALLLEGFVTRRSRAEIEAVAQASPAYRTVKGR